MKDLKLIFGLFIIVFSGQVKGQDAAPIQFKGQFVSYAHYNGSNEIPLWAGARYIPQLNYSFQLENNKLIDFEYSANIFGNAGLKAFSNSEVNGKLKNYRAWIRYSSEQLEIRAGLQKINFGSANMLRPLMWFDQIDPRDPLRLTDGVWGILARYYFLNNTNIWLWGLYGNNNPKGWELTATSKKIPEFGGRIQTPVYRGELGFSYHHRKTNEYETSYSAKEQSKLPENRFGFDARFDMAVGWWIEGTWVSNKNTAGILKNQEIINLGFDYTFASGLYVIYEQLLMAYDKKAFAFNNSVAFSLLNLSFPIGLFDNLNGIFYYDWTNKNSYNFLNWQKQFDNISLHLIAYWNPKIFNVPTQNTAQNLFGGKGIQAMFVWNY